MPYIGTVGTKTSTTKDGSAALTFTQSIPAGHTIMLGVQTQALSGQQGDFSAVDTKDNLWEQKAYRFKSGTLQLSVLRGVITTPLTTADSVTISHPAADVNLWAALAEDFDDAADFDVVAVADGASTYMQAGPTAPAAQSSQLVVGFFAFGGSDPSFAPGAGFKAGGKVQVTNGTNYRNLASQYAYVDTTGTRTASATSLSSSVWAAAVVALNAAASDTAVAPFWVVDEDTQQWVPLEGDVYMLRSGKWVLL